MVTFLGKICAALARCPSVSNPCQRPVEVEATGVYLLPYINEATDH